LLAADTTNDTYELRGKTQSFVVSISFFLYLFHSNTFIMRSRCNFFILGALLAVCLVSAEKQATTCRTAVKNYLDHRLATANASKFVASKKSEMAEAHRCPLHPPTSSVERAMDKLDYLQYCMTWAQRVNEELLAATASLVSLEDNVVSKAVASQKICVGEALAASQTSVEFPARLLYITALEVLRSIYNDYNENAFVDFTNYLEITVRRGYVLYRRLIGRVITNTKIEDTSFHAATASAPHSKGNPLFDALAKIIRLSIPDHLATAAQLAGIALGPVLVIAAISAMLVLFLPILLGYLLVGCVLFQFWLRALLVEGTLSQLHNSNSLVVLASKLLSESPVEVFLFLGIAVTLVFLVAVISFPWLMAVWTLVEIPSSATAVESRKRRASRNVTNRAKQ
jgi:hypothetical protein